MELSDQMKTLLKDLGVALHHALTRDNAIKHITDRIKGNGYDIYLIIEANIALDKRDNGDEGQVFFHGPEEHDEMRNPDYNTFDRDFLSSLQIRTDEE